MYLVAMVLASLFLLGMAVFASGVIAALLIARHELKQHRESWRLG